MTWQAKAEIDVPWGFDKADSQAFCVTSMLDLNQHLECQAPFDDSKQKTFGSMCCESGPLDMNVNLEKVGYVCGEPMKINVRVENNSNKAVTVKASLVQKITFTHPKVKAEVDELCKNVIKKVDGGGNDTLAHEMKVPVTSPSTLGMVSQCNVAYFLKVAVS